MQSYELDGLCYQLCRRLPYGYELRRVIDAIDNAIVYASDKKIDKDGDRRMKEMLYRIETLFREIEDALEESQLSDVVLSVMSDIYYGEEGKYSKAIGKSLRSSIASDIKLVIKGLRPFTRNVKSLISRETMVGTEFHHQKQQLIELLLDSNSSPRVIILGKPGSGKSTLVWHALRDSRVQKYFYKIVSGRFQSKSKWDRTNESLTVVDDTSDVDEIKSLLSVDEEVLLDLNFFRCNAKGNKIVIISSLQLDVEHVAASKISLPSLDEDESWILFQNIAFKDQESPHTTLMDIGRKICHRCQNFPGVINIVASILSSKSTAHEWENFLNVVMTSVPNPVTTISSMVELAKKPNNDKSNWGHCFAWCSLLPTDYEFRKEDLFHLWRAQENFRDIRESTTYNIKSKLEKQLDPCFNEFLRKGYFLEGGTIGSTASYKISHLVFELMKYVAGDDFYLLDKTTPEPNHKIVRHASFIVDPSWDPPSWLLKAKQLQSLLLWPRNSGEFICLSKIDVFLSGMTHLRALHAEAILCERLPEFLVKFKNLRYLRFGAVSSISIPKDIPALQKLLDCDIRYNSFDGNLEQQQEEELVIHVKFVGMEYQKCYDPNSSKQTNKKTGFLKFRLTSFNSDDEKLEHRQSLNPPKTLERQNVCQWKGGNLPAWPIDNVSFFPSSLLSIQIVNFSGCQRLPGFNTLPHLSSLQLVGMCALVDITICWENSESYSKKTFYPSLKCLVLCDLPELKGWSSTDDYDDQHYCFPVLTEVRVQCCPKLISMPSVPKLDSLKATSIDSRMLNRLIFPPVIDPSLNVDNQELGETSEQHLSHVRILEIDGCREFAWGNKPNGNDHSNVGWHAIKSLHSLKLTNIPELTSLPIRHHQCFMMLKQFSLCWLANLKVLPEWIGKLTHLRQLVIRYCPKLTMLPKSDGSFSALEQLEIRYCPRLSQFPGSLPNLKRLQLQEFIRLGQILCVSQNLEELEINNCDELEWDTPSVEGDASVNVWESLKSLHSLKLTKMDAFPKGLDFADLSKLSWLIIEKCPKLSNLPESLCSLSSLQHLQIHYCPGLINLPRNFKKLASLKKLEIRVSTQLEKRCKPDGEDWSRIKHIPTIIINDSQQQNGAEQQSVA